MLSFWIRGQRLFAGLLFLVTLALLSACGRGGETHSDVQVDLDVTPDPPTVGPATIEVALSDAAGQPLTGASVQLEGNMSHAGMTPVFATAEEIAPGRYQAPIEFTMGGDWVITVKAELADLRTLQRDIDLPGVTAP